MNDELNSRRHVNSDVGDACVRTPTRRGTDRIMKAPWLQPLNCFLSPAKAGAGFKWDVIPGLRSLRSLHPGLNSVAATRLVGTFIQSGAMLGRFFVWGTRAAERELQG